MFKIFGSRNLATLKYSHYDISDHCSDNFISIFFPSFVARSVIQARIGFGFSTHSSIEFLFPVPNLYIGLYDLHDLENWADDMVKVHSAHSQIFVKLFKVKSN